MASPRLSELLYRTFGCASSERRQGADNYPQYPQRKIHATDLFVAEMMRDRLASAASTVNRLLARDCIAFARGETVIRRRFELSPSG
jgi:hypothetical protein